MELYLSKADYQPAPPRCRVISQVFEMSADQLDVCVLPDIYSQLYIGMPPTCPLLSHWCTSYMPSPPLTLVYLLHALSSSHVGMLPTSPIFLLSNISLFSSSKFPAAVLPHLVACCLTLFLFPSPLSCHSSPPILIY